MKNLIFGALVVLTSHSGVRASIVNESDHISTVDGFFGLNKLDLRQNTPTSSICTNDCCPEEALCCGGNCYPELAISDTTVCCGDIGFDTSQTGVDNGYCCGDTLITYDGPNYGLNCCDPQSANACLGNQICCPDGSCTPVGTDCTPPGQTCGEGQFVCGDRCGSYNFGDSCCPTSNNETHLLCGLNTQCCGDGCCPDDWLCTSAGGCIPLSTHVERVGNFVSNSCIVDDVTYRVLDTQIVDSGGMTVEECVRLAGSHKYAAVEYGDECYFGDTLRVFRPADDNNCFMSCSGNISEICGGQDAMNLYVNENFVPPTTTKSAPATSTPTPLPTLSASDIISLLLEAQDIINSINDLLQQWQTAIQNESGGSGNSRALHLRSRPRSLTATEAQTQIQQQGPPKILRLRLIGGDLRTSAQNAASNLASGATSGPSEDEIPLLELSRETDELAEDVNEAEEAVTNASVAEATDATVATSTIALIGTTIIGVGGFLAFLFATLNSGGGNNGNGITTALTVGGTLTTITTTPTPTSTTSSTTSSSLECSFSAAASAAILGRAVGISCDDTCATGIKDDYPVIDDDNEFDGDYEKRGFLDKRYIRDYTLLNNEGCDFAWSTANAPYPPTSPGNQILNVGAESLNIVKFLDIQMVSLNINPSPFSLCSWNLVAFPARQTAIDGNGNVIVKPYHTEHVFEIHFLKSFMGWVLQENIIDCSSMVNTFESEVNGREAIQDLVGQLTWWSIQPGNPPDFGIPVDNGVPRFEELFILEGSLNTMKNRLLFAGGLLQPNSYPEITGEWGDVYLKLRDLALVYEYMNRDDVHGAFERVVARFVAWFVAFDAALPPGAERPGDEYDNSWARAFKNWVQLFMNARQIAANNYRQLAVTYISQHLQIGRAIQPNVYAVYTQTFNALINPGVAPSGKMSPASMSLRAEYLDFRP